MNSILNSLFQGPNSALAWSIPAVFVLVFAGGAAWTLISKRLDKLDKPDDRQVLMCAARRRLDSQAETAGDPVADGGCPRCGGTTAYNDTQWATALEEAGATPEQINTYLHHNERKTR